MKAGLCPAFERKKKPFGVIYDLYKIKQFHWLLCVAKYCDWTRKIAPLSNLTRASLLVEWKLTAKAELSFEIYKSWRKCEKNQVSFCHRRALWAEKLGRCLTSECFFSTLLALLSQTTHTVLDIKTVKDHCEFLRLVLWHKQLYKGLILLMFNESCFCI